MNKGELINSIATEAGLSKTDSRKALDAALQAISNTLKTGNKVNLVGFGTFEVSKRIARQGVNPRTMQVLEIPEKKLIKFRAGSELIDALNEI